LQLKAIAKVKSIGGIVKQDPNSVKKNFTSPEVQQKISKRIRAGKLKQIESDMSFFHKAVLVKYDVVIRNVSLTY